MAGYFAFLLLLAQGQECQNPCSTNGNKSSYYRITELSGKIGNEIEIKREIRYCEYHLILSLNQGEIPEDPLEVGIASGNCIVIYPDIWVCIAISIMIYPKTYFIDLYI